VTINVVIKCVDGIVLGADSLMTLRQGSEKRTIAVLPFHSKLLGLGGMPIGVMLNGQVTTPTTTAKAAIRGFVETETEKYAGRSYSVEEVATHLRDYIDDKIGKTPKALTITLGGYSRGGDRSFGEAWFIAWPTREIQPAYPNNEDFRFGVRYIGSPEAVAAVERFVYGMDVLTLGLMYNRRCKLFKSVSDYIIQRLRGMDGVTIPDEITALEAPSVADSEAHRLFDQAFDVFQLVEDDEEYEFVYFRDDRAHYFQRVMQKLQGRYFFLDRYASLRMAIELCRFLLTCAYVRQNLAQVPEEGPDVGSELSVATVTRERGFEYVLRWHPMASSIPTH